MPAPLCKGGLWRRSRTQNSGNFVCACGAGETEKVPKGLQVGFGRESILPDQDGVQIAGGDASARISDGYRDEVAATCIAIKEGDQTILLYTIDFITVDKHVYAAQEKIVEATVKAVLKGGEDKDVINQLCCMQEQINYQNYSKEEGEKYFPNYSDFDVKDMKKIRKPYRNHLEESHLGAFTLREHFPQPLFAEQISIP